ncbi:neuropeptide Y receptor type 2-like [Penaeus vannamei]|uniref:neuropeptide Y receptor type 2-like n=1 Tax=Penaeus vannamei TaxID=6689 RepID=UPI00387F6D7E
MTSPTNPDLRHLPDKILAQIIHTIQTYPNETVDFSRPVLRRTLRGSYPLFVTLYCLLALAGAVANSAMLSRLCLARPFYSDPTCVYVMNLGVCNLLASLVLLPLSLVVLLLHNWVLGGVLCYLLPMLQDVPIHATMATFVVISADRHRKIASPLEPRVSASTAVAGIWVAALSVVLPYVMYVNYIDLQVVLGRQFSGVGICTLNMNDNIALYIRLLYGLLLVKNEILETRQNSGHFDITYITFVWVAFLPAVTTPIVFAAWKYGRWDTRSNQLSPRTFSGQTSHVKQFNTNV